MNKQDILEFKKKHKPSDVNLPDKNPSEVEAFFSLISKTISVGQFFNKHYCAPDLACYVKLNHFSSEFINKGWITGCLICPLKTPKKELIEYYSKDSYAWCPIYNLLEKSDFQDTSEEMTEDCLKLPGDINHLKVILNQYLALQKLVLVNRTKNPHVKKVDFQPFLDKVIEAISKKKGN